MSVNNRGLLRNIFAPVVRGLIYATALLIVMLSFFARTLRKKSPQTSENDSKADQSSIKQSSEIFAQNDRECYSGGEVAALDQKDPKDQDGMEIEM
jgi:hypothetical protein